MKAHALLALLLTACGGIGDLGSDGGLGDLVGDRADRHAEFEDLRQARKNRMPLGGAPRAGSCKKFKVQLSGIDPDRSLFVHDQATLDEARNGGVDFSLRRVLTTLTDQAVAGGADPALTTAETLFTSVWQSQSPIAPDTTCPDATGLLHGFPYSCRPEGDQILDPATEIDSYYPIALVNRMDNISADFSDCGEHRIVYARTVGPANERNFIIFEGVLPNPLEGCKEGCRPVARWWTDLSAEPDPVLRAAKLEELYFRPGATGPKGFRPVIHFDHYSVAGVDTNKLTAKGGQIRTNQKFIVPWQLKEYKTVLDCAVQPCTASVIPVEVKAHPFGLLFDAAEEFTGQPWSPLTPLLHADIIAQRDLLVTGTSAADFTYEPDPLFNAGEGPVDGFSDYTGRADAQFKLDIEAGGPAGFTADQILNRAIALNCAGCHEPQKYQLKEDITLGFVDTIGPGLSFPNSLRFVHTDDIETIALPTTTVFGTGEGFAISPALIDVFLPHRAENLLDLVNTDVCVCQPVAPAALAAQGRARRDAMLRSAVNELDGAMAAYDAIRADNDALEAAGIRVDRSDELAARDAIDEVVSDSGEAMLALLASEGVEEAMADDDDVDAATPFRWRGTDPVGDEVQAATDAEPPRRTITGSFNVH